MDDKELLGQMFMISYPEEQITKFVLNFIKEKNLGGIKIFGWNAKNLHMLIESINKAQSMSQNNRFKTPLFIATDQEGGWTQHIKLKTSKTIGNLGITATLSPNDSYLTGYHIANELRQLGINLNFAPITDIYSNEENFTIGPRTYSNNPQIVSLFALAFYKGQKQAGIISTAKHFPGHGNTIVDSHIKMPIINSNLKEMQSNELLPYKILIQENIPMIMSGHLAYPMLTNGKEIPASSSIKIIKELLRKKLKYDNLIITDDLLMNAVRYNNESIYDTIERIIRTETDILLISLNENIQNNAYNKLLSLMQKDSEIRENIIKSNKRILRIKLEYLKERKNETEIYSNHKKVQAIPTKEAKNFFEQSTLRGITKIKLSKQVSKHKKTLLISPYNTMIKEGKKIFQNSSGYYYDYYPLNKMNPTKLKEIKKLIEKHEQVIFNLSTPASQQYIENLKEYKDKISIIVSLTPQYIKNLDWIQNIVIVYGTTILSFKSGFLTLTEDFNPKGKSPLINFKP
ncbi:glycoside hydrolase family 3 N-terminal domain-containing protein [Borrelia venezuelensis]|uniref:glycoside hydrolase family 3 N-terminal domain-containing protein n=1 Tax=Borrelia venezuelensis TaxID=1653839 RepID=UPI001FF2293B|nr:glycoside hydrolase family 3 protein [Borrelia venezuelensis]UPA12520.1 glycoside hydrolase family 3 protein [Borrelia venezuelensis]